MQNKDKNSTQKIPASWIEETTVNNGTEMLDAKSLSELRASDSIIKSNEVKVTTLICDVAGKEKIAVLNIESDAEPTAWEIGRDADCDIVLDHSSVSTNHAQIIHHNNRWKIVNLISTNGIMVNGQKKLTAFLSDGDKIGLGLIQVIFRTPQVKEKINNKPEKTKSKKWFLF